MTENVLDLAFIVSINSVKYELDFPNEVHFSRKNTISRIPIEQEARVIEKNQYCHTHYC